MSGAGLDPGWPAEPSSCLRMNQQLQTKAMALLTALLQGASAAERKVGVKPVVGLVGGGAGGQCAPQWACRMGAHGGAKSPESPSHPPQHMLDYLWQRNLRQFIYKVGRTRPGRPFPTPLLAAHTHTRELAVLQNIIHSAAPLGDEMAHHLYVLQALTLGLLEPRMRTPLDPYSQVGAFGAHEAGDGWSLALNLQS